MVAILDSSREDFATFLDLLYGKDVDMELLSMTRLLALSGLEDRFLTHQRRAHKAVAARKITAEEGVGGEGSGGLAEGEGAGVRQDG